MKNVILLLSVLFLASCHKEESGLCNCKDVKGKYYANIQKAFLEGNTTAIEDYEFDKGSLTVHRETEFKKETFKDVAKYEVLDNCVIRFHSLNKSVYKPLPSSYTWVVGVCPILMKESEVSEPMIDFDCDGFNFRATKMLTFYPR